MANGLLVDDIVKLSVEGPDALAGVMIQLKVAMASDGELLYVVYG